MNHARHFVLITDTFSPLRNSGAIQLRDLSREFVKRGYRLTVLVPVSGDVSAWSIEEVDGVEVVRLRSPMAKDVGHIRRTLAELIMPFAMRWNLLRSPVAKQMWDGIIWYSPSIFHGPLVKFLKHRNRCKTYLIVRDIFPDWARDMGLIGHGLPFLFFASVARYQYSVADIIGVQTSGNLHYFQVWAGRANRQLEVLPNWLGPIFGSGCPINVSHTSLSGRSIFVYAGNMGVAQGMDILLDLAERLLPQLDIGFLFVGRGSDVSRLKLAVSVRKLTNIQFFDEIHPDEIPGLFAQCMAGIVTLDPRHKSHNIPGKFLTYMQNGLPVLAVLNSGNDLSDLIRSEQVGQVCESTHIGELLDCTFRLIKQIDEDEGMSARCKVTFDKYFTVHGAVTQIAKALIDAT